MQVSWSPEAGIHVDHVDGWPGWSFDVLPTRDGGVRRITMTAPANRPITRDDFRRAPYGLLRRLCGSSSAVVQASSLVPHPSALRPYSRDHLVAVATLYRFAVTQSTPAAPMIADVFDVSTRTAQRWVNRARRLELIGLWEQERLSAPPRVNDRVGEHVP